MSHSARQTHCRLSVLAVAAALSLAVTWPALADDARDLAARIDKHLETRYKSDGVTPAERSDDAEFLRRVSLHIGGTIPPVSEARRFLRDGRRTKGKNSSTGCSTGRST